MPRNAKGKIASSRTGKRFNFMAYTPIADIKMEDIYVKRWRIVETPWFSIFLHKIMREDRDRHLHDHPWSFVSLLLRGAYIEERHDRFSDSHLMSVLTRRVRWINRMRRGDYHRIAALVDNRPVWSLLFLGPRRQSWGFQTERGWVSHIDYFADKGYTQ